LNGIAKWYVDQFGGNSQYSFFGTGSYLMNVFLTYLSIISGTSTTAFEYIQTPPTTMMGSNVNTNIWMEFGGFITQMSVDGVIYFMDRVGYIWMIPNGDLSGQTLPSASTDSRLPMAQSDAIQFVVINNGKTGVYNMQELPINNISTAKTLFGNNVTSFVIVLYNNSTVELYSYTSKLSVFGTPIKVLTFDRGFYSIIPSGSQTIDSSGSIHGLYYCGLQTNNGPGYGKNSNLFGFDQGPIKSSTITKSYTLTNGYTYYTNSGTFHSYSSLFYDDTTSNYGLVGIEKGQNLIMNGLISNLIKLTSLTDVDHSPEKDPRKYLPNTIVNANPLQPVAPAKDGSNIQALSSSSPFLNTKEILKYDPATGDAYYYLDEAQKIVYDTQDAINTAFVNAVLSLPQGYGGDYPKSFDSVFVLTNIEYITCLNIVLQLASGILGNAKANPNLNMDSATLDLNYNNYLNKDIANVENLFKDITYRFLKSNYSSSTPAPTNMFSKIPFPKNPYILSYKYVNPMNKNSYVGYITGNLPSTFKSFSSNVPVINTLAGISRLWLYGGYSNPKVIGNSKLTYTLNDTTNTLNLSLPGMYKYMAIRANKSKWTTEQTAAQSGSYTLYFASSIDPNVSILYNAPKDKIYEVNDLVMGVDSLNTWIIYDLSIGHPPNLEFMANIYSQKFAITNYETKPIESIPGVDFVNGYIAGLIPAV
jgi:hypothetical protein